MREGRRLLEEAKFKDGRSDVPAGGVGEMWFNRFDYPFLVSYYAGDTGNFATRSLQQALDNKDLKP